VSTNNPDIAVAVYDHHTQAENAVRTLQRAGFDMKKISIIGKDCESEEHVIGFLNAGDRAKIFGKYGALWGGLIGVLFGLLMVHGDSQEISRAQEVLQSSRLSSFDRHGAQNEAPAAAHAGALSSVLSS
jgi:hypothetical protein